MARVFYAISSCKKSRTVAPYRITMLYHTVSLLGIVLHGTTSRLRYFASCNILYLAKLCQKVIYDMKRYCMVEHGIIMDRAAVFCCSMLHDSECLILYDTVLKCVIFYWTQLYCVVALVLFV